MGSLPTMSDDAIERDLEERLRACQLEGHQEPLVFLRVYGEHLADGLAGLEVAVCRRCERRFVADPMQGDGGEWDQDATAATTTALELRAGIDQRYNVGDSRPSENAGPADMTPAGATAFPNGRAGEVARTTVPPVPTSGAESPTLKDAAEAVLEADATREREARPDLKQAGPCLPGARRCIVRTFHGPGRVHLAHADWCPTNPGESIDASDYAGSQPAGSRPWDR